MLKILRDRFSFDESISGVLAFTGTVRIGGIVRDSFDWFKRELFEPKMIHNPRRTPISIKNFFSNTECI
jgi:hypothetical protein